MKWEEYQKQAGDKINLWNWKETDIECPDCGELIYKNISLVLTSYPPQYSYKCPKCKWHQTGF